MMTRRRERGVGRRRAARTVTAMGLGAVGALHLVWATGSAFPAHDRETLAKNVVGAPEAPGPGACTVVGVGLMTVAAMIASGRPRRLSRLVSAGAAVGLGLRAAAGGDVALRVVGLPQATDSAFRRWDTRLYRPLCAALALSAAVSAARRSSRPGAVGPAGLEPTTPAV